MAKKANAQAEPDVEVTSADESTADTSQATSDELTALKAKLYSFQETHEMLMGEAAQRHAEQIAELQRSLELTRNELADTKQSLAGAIAELNGDNDMATENTHAYVNPDPKASAGQRPKLQRRRPKKPTGAYLAVEPVEIATGNGGRVRLEVGQRLPDATPEETLAQLEANKLIEPEYTEDATE